MTAESKAYSKTNGKRGITIGAFTSQPLGNLAVSSLDHHFKERYHVKCLHRYCDDNVMLAKTKGEAKFLLMEYTREAEALGLVVKANSFYSIIKGNKHARHRKRQRGKIH